MVGAALLPTSNLPTDGVLDIKLSNLMLTIEDETMLTDFEAAERREPSARKNVDQVRSIYASRAFRRPQNHAWGYPVLCDFGEARMGGAYAYEEIQPEVYKTPEIIMQTEWSHSVDIWNVACLVSPSTLPSLCHRQARS